MAKASRVTKKKEQLYERYMGMRAFERRLKPPLRRMLHVILYVLAAIVALLLLVLAFVPGLQVFVAAMFAQGMAHLLSRGAMAQWLPVRAAKKMITFSMKRLLVRTKYYEEIKDRLTQAVLLPEEAVQLHREKMMAKEKEADAAKE